MPKDLTGDPEDLDELSEDTKAHEASIASVSKADRFPTLVPPEPETEEPWFTRFNHFVGQLEFQRQSRLKVLGLVAKCLIATAIITVLILIYLFGRNFPNQQSLLEYRPALTTQVVARDGQVRDEFALLRRTYTPIADIPELVQHAFVSAEDKNFFRHPGFDLRAISIAAYETVMSGGANARGASTITQQVLKNLALQDQPIMERKIREIALASHLEDLLGKHKILEIYLNEIFLGQNSYGVTAAAQTYFNKSLEQLTSYEAATLAAFAQNPSRLHPVRNRQRLTTRRNYVLQEMFENGYLPEDQLTISLKHSVETVQSGASPSYLASLPDRTYVTDGIRRELSRDLGPEVFQTAGLTIEPSTDERLQSAAENALRRTLERFDRNKRIWRPTGLEIDQVLLEDEPRWREALARAPIARDIHLTTQWRPAVVLSLSRDNARIGIEGVAEDQDGHWLPFSRTRWRWRQNDDGTRGRRARRMSDLLKVGEVVQVRAVLDARGRFVRWSLRQIPELQGAFMAMDPMTGRILALQGGFSYQHSPFNRASQAMRQPGSTFKPFVYAAALNDGVSPYSRVLDARVAIETEDGMWRPENADHIEMGSMPIRIGIEQSRNLMTVRLAQSVGLEPIGQLSEDLGLYDEMAPLWSNVLGAQETTLERLIAAYAAFANGGHLVQPTLVSRALDRNGAPLSGIGSDQSRIDTRDPELSPLVAYQISRMLRGVVLHGTARNHVFLDVPTAGKTGTTNDSKDAWFIGFTSNLVAGCYIGYDTPRTIEHNATGASVCGPVFQSFMREAVQIYGGSQFALLD